MAVDALPPQAPPAIVQQVNQDAAKPPAGMFQAAKDFFKNRATGNQLAAAPAALRGLKPAELAKTNAAAAAELAKATQQATLPEGNFFKPLSVQVSPATVDEQALTEAKPFNGQVVQIVNDGNPSVVRLVAPATITIPQATYGQVDANSLVRISRADNNGTLKIEIGNLLSPNAAPNIVYVPAGVDITLATETKDATGQSVWHSAKLPQLALQGSADDQAKLRKQFSHELGDTQLVQRFLDIEAFAKQQAKTVPQLLNSFKQNLAQNKTESALIGEAKAGQSINQLPIVNFDQVVNKSLALKFAKFDTKALEQLTASLTKGELVDALKAKVQEIAKGNDVLFLPLAITQSAVAVPTFTAEQDIVIKSKDTVGAEKAYKIPAGTVVTADDRSLLETAIAKGTGYSVDPSLAKAFRNTTTYVLMNKDPITGQITSGMLHLDDKTQVVAVSSNSGLYNTPNAPSAEASPVNRAAAFDLHGDAVSAKHFNPLAVSHEVKAADILDQNGLTAMLTRFDTIAQASAPKRIVGEEKNPVLAAGAKLPSEGWVAKMKSMFGKN